MEIGDKLPKFKAVDQDGEEITSDDFLGSPFVLYFYPKDNTPGCTAEACSFRDVMDSFDDIDVLVVGVSPDSPDSHQKFIEEHELNFPLISDEKMDICKKFNVLKDGKVVRSTFLFDEDGNCLWSESPVNVEKHTERVMAAIEDVLE